MQGGGFKNDPPGVSDMLGTPLTPTGVFAPILTASGILLLILSP